MAWLGPRKTVEETSERPAPFRAPDAWGGISARQRKLRHGILAQSNPASGNETEKLENQEKQSRTNCGKTKAYPGQSVGSGSSQGHGTQEQKAKRHLH